MRKYNYVATAEPDHDVSSVLFLIWFEDVLFYISKLFNVMSISQKHTHTPNKEIQT